MSRRIDDLGVQIRTLDGKLDSHKITLDGKLDSHKVHIDEKFVHMDEKFDEIIDTLGSVKSDLAVKEAAVELTEANRERSHRTRIFSIEAVSALALIGSVFASAIAAHVI